MGSSKFQSLLSEIQSLNFFLACLALILPQYFKIELNTLFNVKLILPTVNEISIFNENRIYSDVDS